MERKADARGEAEGQEEEEEESQALLKLGNGGKTKQIGSDRNETKTDNRLLNSLRCTLKCYCTLCTSFFNFLYCSVLTTIPPPNLNQREGRRRLRTRRLAWRWRRRKGSI